MLRAGRAAEPEKMTSSISLPRTDVGLVSPITQRSASNRLDLPQPLGPTTAVRPGSTKSSVGSTNDLNPESVSRVNFNEYAPPYAAAITSWPRENPTSLLKQSRAFPPLVRLHR